MRPSNRRFRPFRVQSLLWVLLACAGCANIGAPTGGNRDTKGPALRAATPANQTLRFGGKLFIFYFDEFLQPASQDVFISPLPNPKPKIVVSGKKLLVRFDKPLLDSTTYVITLGRGIKDATEGNPMTAPYVYAVSTGDKIDTCTVAGQIRSALDGTPRAGYTVLLFPADSIRGDSFTDRRPLYATQADTGGFFALAYVKPGRYRLLAIGDVDNNYRLSPGGNEPVATTPPGISDTIVLTEANGYQERTLFAYKPDAGAPRLTGYTLLNSHTVELQFSEPLLSGEAYWVGGNSAVNSATLPPPPYGQPLQNRWRIALPNALTDSLQLRLTALTDTAGYAGDTTFWLQRPPLPADTTFKLEEFKNFTKSLAHNPMLRVFEATANLPADSLLLPFVHLKDTSGKELPVKLQVSGTLLTVDVSALKADLKKSYKLRIDSLLPSAPMGLAGKSITTTQPLLLDIKPTDPTSLGILLGSVDTSFAPEALPQPAPQDSSAQDSNWVPAPPTKPLAMPIVVVLEEMGTGKRRSQQSANPNFRFDHLPPGNYRLGLLYDSDNNGYWTPPRLSPRTDSEVFRWLPDVIQIRANWEIILPPIKP